MKRFILSIFWAAWRQIKETVRRWNENDGNLLAASMAYYAGFSFFPLLLVLIAGLGLALRFSRDAGTAEQELLDLLSKNVAPALADQVKVILADVRIHATFSGPIGLAVLLFGAIAMFNQLDFAFDRLWRIEPPPAGILRTMGRVIGARFKAFLILCALGVLIISAFLVGIVLSALENWADRWQALDRAWEGFEVSAGLGFHAVVFTILYKTLPKTKVMWRHAFTGGLCVAVVWEIGRLTMSYIIAGRSYTPYGVVGSFIAVMVWVYYASSLIFLGAQFVEVLEKPNELPKGKCHSENGASGSAVSGSKAASGAAASSPAGQQAQPGN